MVGGSRRRTAYAAALLASPAQGTLNKYLSVISAVIFTTTTELIDKAVCSLIFPFILLLLFFVFAPTLSGVEEVQYAYLHCSSAG